MGRKDISDTETPGTKAFECESMPGEILLKPMEWKQRSSLVGAVNFDFIL